MARGPGRTVRVTVPPMAFYRLDTDAAGGPLPALATAPMSVARRPVDDDQTILDRLLAMPLPALAGRPAREAMCCGNAVEPVPSEVTAVSGTRRRVFRVMRRTA